MNRLLLGALVVAVSLGLSGCVEPTPGGDVDPGALVNTTLVRVLDANQNPLDPALFPGDLPVFDLLVSSPRISGEPTLGVTREGSVFFAAIDFDVDVPQYGSLPSTRFVRSTDGGLTWTDKSPQVAGVPTHPTSFDPYVYVDPTTGRVYALDMGPHVACNKVSWSDDEGETWVTRDGACIPGANDHPTLFAGPATMATNTAVYPNQLYLCVNQVTDSLCYQSADGGITWGIGAPVYVGYDPMRAEVNPSTDPDVVVGGLLEGLCGGLHGHGHASFADGTVYIGRSYCGLPTVARSTDGGLTWEWEVISTAEEHSPTDHDISIGTDSDGTAYAFWVGNGATSVYLSKSTDRGASWSTPMNVTLPSVTIAKLPSLVAGSSGRIAFLYVGSETPLGAEGVRQRACAENEDGPCYVHPEIANATTWNAYIGVSLNANEDEPVFATTLGHAPDAPLKRGDCSGRCFGNEGGMYDFLDIDMDPTSGRIWAALVDVCSADCDGAGKGKLTVHEKAVGAVARMVSGTTLLADPIPER